MIAPAKPDPSFPEDDDLGLDLEDREGVARDEETWEPGDDDDLGIGDDDDAVGLDAQNGPLEAGDDEVERGALPDDEPSWLGDEPAGDLGDDDDLKDDERSWTEGSEPVADDTWDDDLDVGDASAARDDGGDEGFAEEALSLELDRLPALDRRVLDDEEPSEGIEAESAGEPRVAEEPGKRAPRSVSWSWLREGPAPAALAAVSGWGVAWADGLFIAPALAERVERRATSSTIVHALACCDGPSGARIALATPTGVECSHDGGETFARPTALAGRLPGAGSVAWTRDGGGAQLWAAAPLGKLQVLRDPARGFEETVLDLTVMRLASDGARGLIVVGRDPEGMLRALATSDGGGSFEAVPLPGETLERIQSIAIANDAWLCSRRTLSPQLVWGRSGARGSTALPASVLAPMALVTERGQPCAYACAGEGTAFAVVRVVLRASAGRPERIAALPEGLGTPLLLAAESGPEGTTLHVAGTRGWVRTMLAERGDT